MLLQMVQSQKNRPVRIIAALNVDALVGIFVFLAPAESVFARCSEKEKFPE
jgi:hypothetical protein